MAASDTKRRDQTEAARHDFRRVFGLGENRALQAMRGSRAWRLTETSIARFKANPVYRQSERNWNWFWRLVARYMPKRLYARSLIIVITPMILLQSVVAFVFMERHWQTVTQRLSEAVVRDIAAIIDMIETYPKGDDYADVIRIAQDRLRAEDRHPAARPAAAAGAEAVLLDPRRGAEPGDHRQDRPSVLAGHGRQLQHHRNPHPARGQGAAGLRPAQPGLRLEHPHLHPVDGWHLAGAADDRDPLPAQPDPADPAARRSRRKLRQGPAARPRISGRAAPRRCGAPASPSSRCASASSGRSTSARPC